MNGRATRGPGFVVQLETALHPIRSAIKSRSFEAAEPGAPEMEACAIVSTRLQARFRPVGSNRSAGLPQQLTAGSGDQAAGKLAGGALSRTKGRPVRSK